MCLLVLQSNTSPAISPEWLADFYSYNSDGVGVMYSENNQLITKKYLPESSADLIDFYQENIQGRNCAFHLRMRTHGDIDMRNCHPYQVLNQAEHGVDMHLMHNGVLDTGNAKDVTRSDTYHYIKDYLRPLLARDPDFAFTNKFKRLIGKRIGSFNKFVLMDNQGRCAVVNQDAGVYWSGLWLSNTYAWTAPDSLWMSQPVQH
jgi:predicted glutamine amidotransferase